MNGLIVIIDTLKVSLPSIENNKIEFFVNLRIKIGESLLFQFSMIESYSESLG